MNTSVGISYKRLALLSQFLVDHSGPIYLEIENGSCYRDLPPKSSLYGMDHSSLTSVIVVELFLLKQVFRDYRVAAHSIG
jgi:hypothetical protein